MKSPHKKRRPQAVTAASGGRVLSTANERFVYDSVAQTYYDCQLSPFNFKLSAVEDPSQLQKNEAGTKAGQQKGNGYNDVSLYETNCTRYIDDCQYDPVVSLLAQAERRIERAKSDGEWWSHFMLWLSLHCLKTGNAWPEGEQNEQRSYVSGS